MTFKEQEIIDRAVFTNPDEFGDSVVYTDTALNVSTVNVILSHDVILQPSDYDAQVVETGSTIEAPYSDVGEPKKGATFVVDGTTYTVQRITDNDQIFITMAVVKEDTL